MLKWTEVEKYKQDIKDGKAIVIVWHIDDVKLLDEGENLTECQAIEALSIVGNSHDCEYGINWESLRLAIEDIA